MHLTPLVLTAEQGQQLAALVRRPTIPQRLVERTLIALAAADGRPIPAIARDYNRHHAHPYRWTYTGEPLAASVGSRISAARH